MQNVEEMVGLDLHTAKQKGFLYSAKLVRGAYMEQEKDRARKNGTSCERFTLLSLDGPTRVVVLSSCPCAQPLTV